MIALFKRTPRQTPENVCLSTQTPPHLPETTDLPALVKQIDAMEAEAHRLLIDAYATQIRELAKAAAKELSCERKNIAEIPGDPTAWGNLGEGYWEVVMAELSAKDIGRYAREARHWLARHTLAVQRLEAGQGIEPWTKEDRGEPATSVERGHSEAAR